MGIRALARELQLSIGTVSRALNDRPDVNPETRARVKAAAARTGYVPNQSGRSLRRGRTGMIAAVIPSAGPLNGSDSGLFQIFEAVRRTLRSRSMDLIVLFCGPEEDPLDNLRSVIQRRVADAVVVTRTEPGDRRIAFLQSAGIPHVALGRCGGSEGMHYVDFDVETVGRETARRFVRDGHDRLALVTDCRPMTCQDILAAAFQDEARRQGLSRRAVRVLCSRNGRIAEEGREAFAAGPARRPTAVLATHESICAGLYADLADLGLGVGGDVALVSAFPAIDTAALVPGLSFFDVDLDAAGRAIGERLLGQLAESPAERRTLPPKILPVTFVARASHQRAELRVTA